MSPKQVPCGINNLKFYITNLDVVSLANNAASEREGDAASIEPKVGTVVLVTSRGLGADGHLARIAAY